MQTTNICLYCWSPIKQYRGKGRVRTLFCSDRCMYDAFGWEARNRNGRRRAIYGLVKRKGSR